MAKVYNINALRPAIIAAHKAGNNRAITKDMVTGADIDIQYFNAWVQDVNKLRTTVAEYVTLKRALKYGYQVANKDVTEDDVFAARERIFPKWKDILKTGEKDQTSKELHVDEADVEDLTGFVWDFMDSGKGTVETIVTEQIFRKKVESLLGCAIAKNEVLQDGDRDTLKAYQSAQKRITNCNDAKTELEAQKKSYKLLLDGLKDEEKAFKDYLQNKINAVDEELKSNTEKKADAESDLKKYSADAKAILQRIRNAK